MSERVERDEKERRHAGVKQCNLFVNVSLNIQSETWKLNISYQKRVSEKNHNTWKNIYKWL